MAGEQMILHCYVSTYNDLYMMRWYVAHYSQYASKIYVYDDDSTDGTREFLQSCAPLVEVRHPGFHGIDEVLIEEMRENRYKELSRGKADWVIIGDSDELDYHPNFFGALRKAANEGYSAIVAHAYHMISTQAPEYDGGQITDKIKTGVCDAFYNRLIFRPHLDIVIPPGMHAMKIVGEEKDHKILIDPEFKMLHYRYLSEEFVNERAARAWSRMSQRNKDRGWGIHTSPGWESVYGMTWYKSAIRQAQQCID